MRPVPIAARAGPVCLDAEWIKSPTARRILVHWADPRPAWLWTQDGVKPALAQPAARYFNAKVKKGASKRRAGGRSDQGQVARLVRLGVPGRSSLSRVQFLSGGKTGLGHVLLHPADAAGRRACPAAGRCRPDSTRGAGGSRRRDRRARLRPFSASRVQFALVRDGIVIDGIVRPNRVTAVSAACRPTARVRELVIFLCGGCGQPSGDDRSSPKEEGS